MGEVATFKTGKLDSNAAVENGAYPFFTCSRDTFRTNTYSFDDEVVLLAGNNANGIYPLKYFKGKFDAYQRTYVIRPIDESRLDTRFLYFALRPQLDHLRSVSTGSATKFLTMGLLSNLELPLPDLAAQRKIAGILSAYDDLIENNLRRIKILEEMAQSLYREWFVHFRFPGHESAKFVDSPLGQIPKGWEWRKVGDAFEIQGGGTPSTANEEYWVDGEIQWYSPRDLTAEGTMFIEKSAVQINEIGLKKSSAKMFPAYSVMLTSRATIGAIAINTVPACTNQGFITCLPNARAPLYFLHQWLKANVETFILHASGSTFKEISKGVFKGLDFLQPNAGLVQRYEQAVSPVADRLLNLQRSNQTLRRTRDLLLPKLLSGDFHFMELESVGSPT
jgi:type I restriction enzyme S subunit